MAEFFNDDSWHIGPESQPEPGFDAYEEWQELVETKLHDLALAISPEEVDGGVVDGDIVMGYLKGDYDA